MLLRILDRLEETLIGLLMAAATALIFFAVAHRYSMTGAVNFAKWGRAHEMPWAFELGRDVFNILKQINLTWAQELCIYMFVWMAKFGAAYGVRTGIHVGVDVLLVQIDPKSRYRVILFALMCGALFTAIVGAFGVRFVWHIAHTGEISPDLEVPKWLVYLAVPAGSWLMCFRFLQVAWTFARTGHLPKHDESKVEGIEEAALAPVTQPIPSGGRP
ncbi:MAG TPA: TRAP transporter small permease [Rhodoblastus sp.]|nr:TRAP transporter small permease [Rhodoblastus sp.]